MPDTPRRTPMPPADWRDAFAALPAETPPAGGWQAVVAALDARRRPRLPLWLATAAAVLMAVALPWRLQWFAQDDSPAPRDWPAASPAAAADPLETLYAESAQLESLLAVARDDRVSTGMAAVLADDLDAQLASIDAALVQPGLSQDERLSLWRQRVDTLRMLGSFESNRRWLAAHGTRYDGALVHVD